MSKRHPISNKHKAYVATLTPAEAKAHFTIRKYPSGRGSRGGANRSSNIKREVRLKVRSVELCAACGGVSKEIAALTNLFPECICN